MLKAHTLRIYLTILTLALTVGTAFAQEGESGASSTGLTTLILFMGLGAVGVLFVANWIQSAPDETNEE